MSSPLWKQVELINKETQNIRIKQTNKQTKVTRNSFLLKDDTEMLIFVQTIYFFGVQNHTSMSD